VLGHGGYSFAAQICAEGSLRKPGLLLTYLSIARLIRHEPACSQAISLFTREIEVAPLSHRSASLAPVDMAYTPRRAANLAARCVSMPAGSWIVELQVIFQGQFCIQYIGRSIASSAREKSESYAVGRYPLTYVPAGMLTINPQGPGALRRRFKNSRAGCNVSASFWTHARPRGASHDSTPCFQDWVRSPRFLFQICRLRGIHKALDECRLVFSYKPESFVEPRAIKKQATEIR
jgi:hypothetical protein